MLDQALEVAYQEQEKDRVRQEMVEAFMQFPDEELHKIASGEVKLAFYDSDEKWLDKFKGTSYYDQALALEEQKLKLDIADQQARRQERSGRDSLWDARDAICLQKRMLELQLRKEQQGDGGELQAAPPPEPGDAPTDELPQEKTSSAVDYFYARRLEQLGQVAEMLKEAKKKDKNEWDAKTIGALAALPVVGAGMGAGMYGLAGLGRSGAAPAATRLLRGAGVGGTIGTGASGLIAASKLLRKADPEGHTLDTVGRLAPAAAAGYGVLKDIGDDKKKESCGMKTAEAYSIADIWGREMAKQAMVKVANSALEKVASGELELLDEVEWYTIGEMAKVAEARMAAGVEFEDLLDFEKVAWLGAVKAGLQGAGRFLGAAGKGVASAAKAGHAAGGLKGAVTGAGQALGRVGQLGGAMAKQFATKNPLAAAGIAGGAGLAAGGLVGRATKRQQPQVVVQQQR